MERSLYFDYGWSVTQIKFQEKDGAAVIDVFVWTPHSVRVDGKWVNEYQPELVRTEEKTAAEASEIYAKGISIGWQTSFPA